VGTRGKPVKKGSPALGCLPDACSVLGHEKDGRGNWKIRGADRTVRSPKGIDKREGGCLSSVGTRSLAFKEGIRGQKRRKGGIKW